MIPFPVSPDDCDDNSKAYRDYCFSMVDPTLSQIDHIVSQDLQYLLMNRARNRNGEKVINGFMVLNQAIPIEEVYELFLNCNVVVAPRKAARSSICRVLKLSSGFFEKGSISHFFNTI